MINSEQLRLEIIRPTLMYLDDVIPYSAGAENLLMGTCAQESGMFTYIKQLGDGPALGPYQMEDATHDDINDEDNLYDNYLRFRPRIDDKIDSLRIPAVLPFEDQDRPNLTGNLWYATAMARVHYYRAKGAIPLSDDIEGLAHYWKDHYNTRLGKGTVAEFVHNYNRYVK